MNMILRQLGRFKKDALLCIGMTTLEVAMDILLPFITAIIIDRGLEQANPANGLPLWRFDGSNGFLGIGIRRSGR